MAIQIGGIAMPLTMSGRAQTYNFTRGEIIARNGMGEAITGGFPTVSWTWAALDQTEFAWLITTLLLGQVSRTFSATDSTVLYNELWAEEAFDYCIVLRPTYKGYSGFLITKSPSRSTISASSPATLLMNAPHDTFRTPLCLHATTHNGRPLLALSTCAPAIPAAGTGPAKRIWRLPDSLQP